MLDRRATVLLEQPLRNRTQPPRQLVQRIDDAAYPNAGLPWDRMKRLIATWIPSARTLHPYPNQRLALTNPR